MSRSFIILLSLSLVFISCSTTKKSEDNEQEKSVENWVYDPSSSCSAKFLCASGEGQNQTQADSNAKKSLASIFEVQIKSNFKYVKNYTDNAKLSEVKESVVDEVNTQVDQILKGVEIFKRTKKDNLFFSLAVLDKTKTSRVLRQEISRIDDEMLHYFKLKSRSYLKKLVLLFNKREILNEKLILIDNQGISRKLTFQEIKNIKYNLNKTNLDVQLEIAENVPNFFSLKLKNSLTEMGFKVDSKKKSQRTVKMSLKSKEEFLKVKGFKKITFSLAVEHIGKDKKVIGSFSYSITSSGRTEKDALLKVRNKILIEIENKIHELNLD